MFTYLKTIFTSSTVLAAVKELARAVVTAALTAFGVVGLNGCSVLGSGVGVTL